jgi:hypothetical protein
MDRGRVGGDRGSKETDGCPLTSTLMHQTIAMPGDLSLSRL